jgi:hypothetical protein
MPQRVIIIFDFTFIAFDKRMLRKMLETTSGKVTGI